MLGTLRAAGRTPIGASRTNEGMAKHGSVRQSQPSGGAALVAGGAVCGAARPSGRAAQAAAPGAARTASRRAAVRVAAEARGGGEKMTVAITGATGFIGGRLASKLASAGHTVRVLTRDVDAARAKLQYPHLEFFAPARWAEAVAGADAVVNLAGTPIGTRWSDDIKRLIKTSRVDTTGKLVAAIAAAPEGRRPKVLVSSSAVGFYGTSLTATFDESSPQGQDYLAEVCGEWEAAAKKAPEGVRVVLLRTGIVLAADGGVLAKMLPVFAIFAGGPLGSGQQWLSWIHRDDLVALIVAALEDAAYEGAYNGTAPAPVTMSGLCKSLGAALGRPSWMPVPDFALNLLLGEGAKVVLEGQRVLPARAEAQGFKFQYRDVDSALKAILRR